MAKKIILNISLIIALVLIISGCQKTNNQSNTKNTNSENTEQQTKITPQIKNTVKTQTKKTETEFEILSLTTLKPGQVKLTWTKQKEDFDYYIVVRGPQAEIDYPNNYWFKVSKDKNEFTWTGLTGRDEYFKVCIYKNNQKIKCTQSQMLKGENILLKTINK